MFLFFVNGFSQEGDAVQDSITTNDSIKNLVRNMDTLTFLAPVLVKSDATYVKRVSSMQTVEYFKDYLFLFLLFILFLSVGLFNNTRQAVGNILQGITNIKFSIQLSRTAQRGSKRYLWFYFVLFYLTLNVGVWLSIKFLYNQELTWWLLPLCTFLLFYIEYTSYNLAGYLSDNEDFSHGVRYNVLILSIFGLLISIIYLFLVFTPIPKVFSVIYISILVLLFSYKELRVFLVLQAERISMPLFYFFLYICTFKILPVVIVFKIIHDSLRF